MEMETTDVIHGEETKRIEVTITSQFITRAVTSQEPMRA